ncbi:MAG: hypothetical protein QM784_37755 [Polyangiaceae bacterium]
MLISSCSKKSADRATGSIADAGPSARASASANPGPATPNGRASCRAPGKGASFTLGSGAGESASNEGEPDNEQELPFSTTLGSALVARGRFWVSAIDYRHNQSHAVLARIEPGVDRGSVIDLGRVYGDAEPPRIFALGNALLIAMADADAGGRTVKVGRLELEGERNSVEWIESMAQEHDDSSVFGVSASDRVAVVTWDELERNSRRGRVRWSTVAFGATRTRIAPLGKGAGPVGAAAITASKVWSSAPDVDAEAPQIVARQGGFWLGYLAAKGKGPSALVARGTGVASGASKAGSEANREGDRSAEETPVVDLGSRGVELLSLDTDAGISGRPIAVTVPGAHVVAFELESMADGGALVAYRDATSAPGVEEVAIEVARVRPDGGVSRLRLEDERVGAGAPLLLVSSPPRPEELVWIGAAGRAGEMQIATYNLGAAQLGVLVADPLLAGAEPLARDGAALLVARTRGRVVEFERLECDFRDHLPSLNESCRSNVAELGKSAGNVRAGPLRGAAFIVGSARILLRSDPKGAARQGAAGVGRRVPFRHGIASDACCDY